MGLNDPINMSSRYSWVPVSKNCSVTAPQQDSQSTPKVGELETASPSSCPVWQANAAPSFFTSFLASGCHPPGIVLSWMGVTTVISRAASLPPAQFRIRTSAGRRSLPGGRNRPALTGPRPAATAVSNKASLRLLWRVFL